MRTKQLYLDDPYMKEVAARVLDARPAEGAGRWRLILDRTVFYPMGGGQPTDQGTLSANDWSGDVYQVVTRDGEIWHYITAGAGPSVGAEVNATIDWERRYRNMRLHSGGHVVDFAMHLLGHSPSTITPMKGDHGKKSYIIYQGTLPTDITRELEDKANELVSRDLRFSWEFQPLDDLKRDAIYLQPGLPTDKPLRTLHLDTVGSVADGGTQVHSTGEVGKIIIRSIQEKNGTTIVNYALES